MVYSFDIFDTLITRITATPQGVFSVVQRKIESCFELESLSKLFVDDFVQIRINAEAESRVTAKRNGKEEVTLEDIYKQMSYYQGLDIETYQKIMNLEVETELELSYPIWENIEKLKKLQMSDTVYLISDMYLEKNIIQKMLINVDDIFVDIPILLSSEVGVTKRTGNLYEYFIEKYGINTSEWIHIGDNVCSDYDNVIRLGGSAKLYTLPKLSDYDKCILEKNIWNMESEIVLGVIRNVQTKKENIHYNMACRVGMPILFGYVWWVLEDALNRGFEELFFVARDGYVLKRIADEIILLRNLNINTYYLYGSRTAWRTPVIYRSTETFIEWIGKGCEFNSIEELAKQLYVDKESLEKHISEEILKTECLTMRDKSYIKCKLISLADTLKKIAEVQSGNWENAVGYLKQAISGKRNCAFVELHGSGYTQKCLKMLIGDFYKDDVVTYYFNMTSIDSTEVSNNKYYTYCSRKLECGDITEILARAPHGITVGYTHCENNLWRAQIEESHDFPDKENYDKYIDGILDCVRLLCREKSYRSSELLRLSCDHINYIFDEAEYEIKDYLGDLPFAYNEQTGLTVSYAPKVSNKQLRQIYLYKRNDLYSKLYPGANYSLAKLRLSKNQKVKVQMYKNIAKLISVRKNERKRLEDVLKGRIVIYGAGVVGRRVYDMLGKNNKINLIAWIDKNYKKYIIEGLDVKAPALITEIKFDYIIVCVNDMNIMADIRTMLLSMGVAEEKIL